MNHERNRESEQNQKSLKKIVLENRKVQIGIAVFSVIVLVGIIVAVVYTTKNSNSAPGNLKNALEITSSEDMKELYAGRESFEITCSVTSAYRNQEGKLQWMDPGNHSILEGSGNPSSYAGPENDSLKLIFLKPTVKHSGNYTCSYSYQDKSYEIQVTLNFVDVSDKVARFKNNYEKVIATEGDPLLSATCSAIGSGPITYEWYDRYGFGIERTSAEDGFPYISQSGSVLNIPKVAGYDSGLYSCKAKNHYGSNSKGFGILIFKDIKPHITFIRNATFYENNRLLLICTAEGAGPLKFEWYYQQNETIKNDTFPGIYVRDQTASSFVVIEPAKSTHEGQYRCVVNSSYGSESKSIYVSMHKDGAPKFSNQHDTRKVFVNNSLRLSCDAKGAEPMAYKWYNQKNESIASDGSQLTIKSAQFTDEGQYRCLAKNKYGAASKMFNVSIPKDGKPEFSPNRSNMTACEEGEEILLCFPNTGAEPMNFTWFNPKSKLIVNSTSYVISSTSDDASYLTIKSVLNSDLGEYRCVAENSYGSATKWFNVLFSRTGPAKVDRSSETVTVETGSKLQLRCQASGELPITYTWYNQTDEITSEEISTTDFGSYLTVERAEMSHFRIYSCVAKNARGLSIKVFHVRVA